MKMRSLIIFMALVAIMAPDACCEPLTVIIVTADSNDSEHGYTGFLQETYRGNVNVLIEPDRYEEDLDSARKSELESADLIIVSRNMDCKDYNADTDFWNGLSVPILNHNIKLARRDGHDYWDWLDGDDTPDDPLTQMEVADPNDPVFDGVDISTGLVEILTVPTVIDHSDQESAGYGRRIASIEGNLAIARWFGDEPLYYPDSDFAPGGPRVFFAMPKDTSEFFDNATDTARLMLKNAILSLVPIYRPLADLDDDRDVDFNDFAVFGGFWGDSECVTPMPCAQADFTEDANVLADDLAEFAACWLDGADSTPPQPDPMTWEVEPMATATTSIYMAATAASDAQNGIEYYFQCVSDNAPDSGWQYDRSFEPNTLTPGTEYTYRVSARDTSSHLNQTEWSVALTARTFERFRHVADASAAAALDANLFIVADDENNLLRIYDSNNPESIPIAEVNITEYLNIEAEFPESDIEGATWLNGRIFWITSHGRNRLGKYWYSRYQFFATTVHQVIPDVNISVDGNNFHFIDDLIAYDSIYNLGLADAIGLFEGHIDSNEITNLAPKIEGLNIEGLCTAADGNSVFIAFRNPRPDVNGVNNALIIELKNPEEVVLDGAAAEFEPPMLLDLGGLGIRSIEYSHTLGKYLIIAGSHLSGDDAPLQILYSYDLPSGLLTRIHDFPIITPEAMFQFPDSNDIYLLSDDGTLLIETPEGPVQNKYLPKEQRTFRTQRVTP